jgi:hypothetical protein
VIGSNFVTDNQQGTIKASGTVTILYDGETVSDMFDNEDRDLDGAARHRRFERRADFVTFSMSRVKIFGDDADDGKKQIVRTFPFVAEINGSGGAALANDQTICGSTSSSFTKIAAITVSARSRITWRDIANGSATLAHGWSRGRSKAIRKADDAFLADWAERQPKDDHK